MSRTLRAKSEEGEVVSHHEFSNAFVNPGGLATIVIDDAVSGGLYVVVTNQNSGSSGTTTTSMSDGEHYNTLACTACPLGHWAPAPWLGRVSAYGSLGPARVPYVE